MKIYINIDVANRNPFAATQVYIRILYVLFYKI